MKVNAFQMPSGLVELGSNMHMDCWHYVCISCALLQHFWDLCLGARSAKGSCGCIASLIEASKGMMTSRMIPGGHGKHDTPRPGRSPPVHLVLSH